MKQNFANSSSLRHSLGIDLCRIYTSRDTIHRHYFAISTNPGEQFYAFTNLAAWLINTCGRNMEQPQEVTNFIICNISGSVIMRPLQVKSLVTQLQLTACKF